jgi:thiol-disulfide isomerase/thioredoxin
MFSVRAFTQQLSGNLQYHANQEIKLLGYNGFETIALAKTNIDSTGNFSLFYKDYKGMGYLETSDKSQLFIVINESNITIKGNHLKEPDSIKFNNSNENLFFNQYVEEHSLREQLLAGWKYLLPLYQQTNQQNGLLTTIKQEIERIEKEDAAFLNKLDKSTMVSWYLPIRKLIDDMPLSAQRYTERIPKHINDFRHVNLNDKRLYYSGILDDLLEGHYLLLENGGMTMDSMYQQMNRSTDYIIENLADNEKLLNEVTHFLFSLMEKRSIYRASEYLALKLLTQSSCTLEDDLVRQLEIYRTMKIGNTAPDIVFTGKKMMMGSTISKDLKLSDLPSAYTLVVFGSSWCPKCTKDIPQIKEKYIPWKLKGVETVFISLDKDSLEFTDFVKGFPFLSVCDFKHWETQAAKDYYVFSTPTLFLLDKNRKIILRPSSIEQIDAWVNYISQASN